MSHVIISRMEIINKNFRWIIRHPVNALIISTYIAAYILMEHVFPEFQSDYLCIFSNDLSEVMFSVICLVFLSGVEVSIGSWRYLIWMIWNTAFSTTIRQFFNSIPTGPSFFIIPVFITFINNHKSAFNFRIKSFKFNDTLFYVILLIQFILFKLGSNIIDIIIIIFSQSIWKLVVLIVKFFNIGNRRPQPDVENY